jgi:hypothetical protein
MELSMSDTATVSPLRQRMIEDMTARKLNPHTQRSHISSCKRFAAWLKRSPDTATPDEVRRFQLHLIESGASICNRNRIMTGVRALAADPRPHRRPPFRSTPAWQPSRLCPPTNLARGRTANPAQHPAIRSFTHTHAQASSQRDRAGGLGSTSPTLSPTLNPHSVRGTAGCPTPPRLRALALFGRRHLESVDSLVSAGVRKPAQKRT